MSPATLSAEHPAEFSQVVESLFEFGRFDAGLSSRAVAFAKKHQVVVVLGLFEPSSCAGAECSVGELVREHVVLD